MPVTRFSNLPLADQSRRWSAAAAEKRVRKRGRRIAGVVDGELKAVRRAIISAAAVVDGARGGVDVPDSDRSSCGASSTATTTRWARRRPGNPADPPG